MAKVFGPCLSISAKGSIKKTITFQKRPSGISAIKTPVIPRAITKNPTVAQSACRTVFSDLIKAWQALTVEQKAVWQVEADYVGNNLSGFHTFMKAGTGLPFEVLMDVLGFYEGDPHKQNFKLDEGLLA